MKGAKKRVAFHTLGCKLNFTETSMIARSLDTDYFEKVTINEPADIYIINTCTVTEAADRKCRQSIRKTIRQAPDDAYIVVVGCYAQLKPEEITSIEGVDLVLGANEKFNLRNYLDRIEESSSNKVHTCNETDLLAFTSSYSMGDRTRSFLKVQDGCDYICSYCTIPLARGGNRNQSIADCVEQAREIAGSGAKEIVITGVNIGDFGKTTGESFLDLLESLVKVEGVERFRISSIEPNLLSDDIIDLTAAEDKLVQHFHIPLQSGCNRMLAKMKRRYNRELFSERVSKVKATIPDACIGADVIVGFPGETDNDFNDTYRFLEKTDLSYLHSFSYSPRPGTAAFDLPENVGKETIAARSSKLQRLSERKKFDFYRKCTDNSYRVIWENRTKDGFIYGFTDNYVRAKTHAYNVLPGDLSHARLTDLDENGIFNVELL
ncbi:MAG TPA: tRNA (N(6)-L-threonylcarbamoyladenosine(37)-C(2))-methylthiotransferase MtaB [Bacteroidales bacterium]|nr:tRNA (N(6)-L-threonylcarbamoyladenosine(37)-C(2))-methylthiotransferase MtaB [Bacteroidales bacterium]